jgi:hypothetical protein
MSRLATLLTTMMLLPGAWLFAQGSEPRSAVNQRGLSVVVSASIIDNTVLTTMRDINLSATGEVDGFINIVPVNSSYAGMMRIQSRPGKRMRITYLTDETLVELEGNGGVVRAKYRLSGFDSDNQMASVLLDVGEATIRIGPEGFYYLWLGALLDIRDAKPGSYISEFIIELEDIE